MATLVRSSAFHRGPTARARRRAALTTRLVDLDRDAVLIPNMPIHFNREVNDGYKYNAQVDLLPVLRR